ncbi:MAG: hypothetical protein J6X39_06255 [Bacteroidales bacterium]|nr:hypothetical protein [Bacteroidales bacterium]
MKRLITLFILLAGVSAFAQHPLTAERQALIRKLSLPILADTLKYAHEHKMLDNFESFYLSSVSSTAILEYSIKDADIYLRWPVQVVAHSDQTMDINGKTYGVAVSKAEVRSHTYVPAHEAQDMLDQPLLAFILFTGGYKITEEIAYPKRVAGSIITEYDNEKMRPSEPLFDLVAKNIKAHNARAESVGSIYEITAFDQESLTLRVAFNGSGEAALLNAYVADPYAVLFALGLDLGIHLYVYDVNVAAAPQYAYFSADDVVKFAKEVK